MPRLYADMILYMGLEHPWILVSGRGGGVLESIPCGRWILREGCAHMGLSWVQNTALFPMCLRQMLRRVV